MNNQSGTTGRGIRPTAWIGVLLALVAAAPAAAQVSVAPTALFLTDQQRFGGLYVSNSSDAAQEVTVEFRFGYPAADTLGNVAMLYDDAAAAEQYSLAGSVRAFPQRFILPPGETQVVRLTAEPPGGSADGLYWTRVVTTSTPQVAFEDPAAVDDIQTRVEFRLQQVTALFYRRGRPDVQVGIRDLGAGADSAGVYAVANIDRGGSGPFFGTVNMRVIDGRGNEVHTENQAIAVYVSERRRFRIDTSALEPGSYTLEVTLSSERNDLPQDQLTPHRPVSAQTQITVPAPLR